MFEIVTVGGVTKARSDHVVETAATDKQRHILTETISKLIDLRNKLYRVRYG